MEIETLLEKIKRKINSELFPDLYGYEWNRRWYKMFRYFFEQIERDAPINLDDYIGDMQVFIERTKEIVLFKALDSDARGHLRDILVFLYNVNANSKRDIALERDIMLCIKILDLCLTLNELIGVAREVISKMRESLLYAPPAFQVAEHYLKTLLDEIEQEDE